MSTHDHPHTLSTDVAVVGLGAWGSQALWRLADRGIDTVGIERFTPGHAWGSTHGVTRLFRVACLEHPGLAPIALRSRDLWHELGERTGTTLLEQSGALMVGPPELPTVAGTLRAGEQAGLDLHRLDRDTLIERFPQYSGVPEHHIALWDPQAGFARPEAGVRAAVEEAERLGATVLSDTRVRAIDADGSGVTIRTPGLTVRAEQVIVATGAWMPAFTTIPLAARRTPLFWFRSRRPEDLLPGGEFDLGRFPAFIREDDDGTVLWGHGARQHSGDDFLVKVGLLDDGKVFQDTDAESVDRHIQPERDFGVLSARVAAAFPGLDPMPFKAIPCMVTNSVDGQFVIGREPGRERVIVAGGDSGHGHKHASGLGEILAQIALGEKPFTEVSFMAPDRRFDVEHTWQKGNALARQHHP